MKIQLKELNKQPLIRQLSILMAIMVVTIIFIMTFSFVSYFNLQNAVVEANHEAIISQTTHVISNQYDYVLKLSTNLAYNELIQEYLEDTKTVNDFDLSQRVSNLLINTQNMESFIIDIAVVGHNGNFTNVAGDISLPISLLNQFPSSRNDIYFFDKQNYYVQFINHTCIVAAKLIYPLNLGATEPSGAVFITIDPTQFLGTTYVENNKDVLEMMLLDSKGDLVLGDENLYHAYVDNLDSPKQTFRYKQMKYIYRMVDIPNMGYQLITLVPSGSLGKQLNNIIYKQLFMILFVFLVIGTILFVFISDFFQTITQLTGIMQSIISGDRRALKSRLTKEETVVSSQEADMLVTSFNTMLDEIEKLNKDIFNSYTKMYDTEIYAKKTELAYLRSQVNPHFLYNTLGLFSGMSTEDKFEDITSIAQSLAQILRYSIKGSEFVTLKEELDIINSYLIIQSSRFEGRFTTELKIEEGISEAQIPKMILQPLVENAIDHGLENSLEIGNLQIGALKDPSNNTLVLWVYDTGLGMSNQRLLEVRQSLATPRLPLQSLENIQSDDIPNEQEDSIGLYNVNSRIQLYYGDDYRLLIDSVENVGTNIQIRIPYQVR